MNSPCINCITLSICKARLDKGDFFDLMGLTDLCNPFRLYMFPHKRPLITASQTISITEEDGKYKTTGGLTIIDENDKISKLLDGLRNNLLDGIDFNENVNAM